MTINFEYSYTNNKQSRSTRTNTINHQATIECRYKYGFDGLFESFNCNIHFYKIILIVANNCDQFYLMKVFKGNIYY